MTFDAVALCREEPGPDALIAAIRATGARADFEADRQLIRLVHPGGRPLLTIEGARLVQVPGEAERLLGIAVPHPVWWVESRAPEEDPEAEAVARTFTEALVAVTGGLTWSC